MQNESQKQIAGAIILAGLIIGGAILLKDSAPRTAVNNNGEETASLNSIKIRPIGEGEHMLGNKNAKLVIVEYSDTECPFCKGFHATMNKIVNETGGEVAWVYRHYPIPQLHAKAQREAEATECAYEQGGNEAFWKYINRMFEITPSNDGLKEEELTSIAQFVGLNTSQFYTCLESGKYESKVAADISDGVKAGVGGTPYSLVLVNGKVVDRIGGNQPIEVVRQIIESRKR